MIAFGSAISDSESYNRYARPGIELAAEADSPVFAFAAVGHISRTYNLMMDKAAELDGLEALVLAHPHAEITDPALCERVRQVFRDPDVAIAGPSGARDVQSIAWWDGKVSSAPVTHRYTHHGGGELTAFEWADPDPPGVEVEVLDGYLLVLSPWTVHNVRFDEALALGHGFDYDFCTRVRAAGGKLVTADLRLTRHHGLELFRDPDLWIEKHIQVAERWTGDASEQDWAARARRAEAEREAARAITYGNALVEDARLLRLQRQLDAALGSKSWKLTQPLRSANRLVKALRGRRPTDLVQRPADLVLGDLGL